MYKLWCVLLFRRRVRNAHRDFSVKSHVLVSQMRSHTFRACSDMPVLEQGIIRRIQKSSDLESELSAWLLTRRSTRSKRLALVTMATERWYKRRWRRKGRAQLKQQGKFLGGHSRRGWRTWRSQRWRTGAVEAAAMEKRDLVMRIAGRPRKEAMAVAVTATADTSDCLLTSECVRGS